MKRQKRPCQKCGTGKRWKLESLKVFQKNSKFQFCSWEILYKKFMWRRSSLWCWLRSSSENSLNYHKIMHFTQSRKNAGYFLLQVTWNSRKWNFRIKFNSFDEILIPMMIKSVTLCKHRWEKICRRCSKPMQKNCRYHN